VIRRATSRGYLFINYTKINFMTTQRVKLGVVLQLLPVVESTLNEAISSYKKSKKHVPEVFDYIKKLSDQILLIKNAKDKGNSKRHSLFGKTNSYWIYERSNTKRLLECAKDKNETATFTKKLEEIDNKLERFNTSTTVKLPIFPEFVSQFSLK
jgi:hypothetical protein